MQKLRIEGYNNGANARVYIDGEKVQVCSINLRMRVGEIPYATLGLIDEPDIEVDADIKYSFTPKTVQCAFKIIEAVIKSHDDEAISYRQKLIEVLNDL